MACGTVWVRPTPKAHVALKQNPGYTCQRTYDHQIFAYYPERQADRAKSRNHPGDKMVNARQGLLATTLWLAIALYPGGASATYVCTTVDLPGATTYSTLESINNVGQATAGAIIPTNPLCSNGCSLVYQATGANKGSWNPLPVAPGFDVGSYGINDFGFIAGFAVPSGASSPEQGFILNRATAT